MAEFDYRDIDMTMASGPGIPVAVAWDKPRYAVRIAPSVYYHVTRQPNAWWRWWQWVLLGWRWSKLEDAP